MVAALASVSALTMGLAAPGSISAVAEQTGQLDPRPNVIVIVTDDQRPGGTMKAMPKTKRWFAQQGSTYPNAFATTPLCCPARASIFSGRYAHNHGVISNKGGAAYNLDQNSTMQRYLDEAGYFTGIFGKYFNGWDIRDEPPFADRWAITTTTPYKVGVYNEQGLVHMVDQYYMDYLRTQILSFLDAAQSDVEPFFLYIAPVAPHGPATPEPAYRTARVGNFAINPAMTEEDKSDKPPVVQNARVSMSKVQEFAGKQLRSLRSVDDMIDEVMRDLAASGDLDNTLAFFLSDNGFLWGEHGLMEKSLPYTQSVKVPFYARWPGHISENERDTRLVANIDIAPTVLQAAGLNPDDEYPMDGRSLLSDYSRDRMLNEYFERVVKRSPHWASLRNGNYSYTEYYADGTRAQVIFREYYDLRADPYQLNNLLGDDSTANDPNVSLLSAQLLADRACKGTSGPFACP